MTLLITTSAIVLVGATPVNAAILNGGWTDNSGVGATASNDNNATPTASGGSGGTLTCNYAEQTGTDASDADELAQQGVITKGSGPGNWYARACWNAAGNEVIDDFIWVSTADPTTLAQQALQYVPLDTPAIDLNPSTTQDQIVNVPMWLWLGGEWNPVSAQASAGGITVTTTATPTQVVWNTGDGQTFTCNGPGTPYDPTRLDDAQHTNCSHTYTRSSTDQPGGVFTVTATETWNVAWTATGVTAGTPAAGNLAAINHSATTTAHVIEVQALNQSR